MLDTLFSFDTLWWVLLVIYVPACLGLIVIVLLQKGKGAGFAGAFGAGAGPGADTVFGPSASKSLPVRMTYAAAAIFMTVALVMSIISGHVGRGMAPDMVEGSSEGSVVTSTTELSDLGLGSRVSGGAVDSETTPEAQEIDSDTSEIISVEVKTPDETGADDTP